MNKQISRVISTIVISLAILSMSYCEGTMPTLLHESTHDEFMKDKTITAVNTRTRLLNSDLAFRNYRIHFDWTQTNAWLAQQPSNVRTELSAKIEFMKGVFKTVGDYFRDRFQVYSRAKMQLPSNQSCHGAKAADSFYDTPIDQDMVIAFKPHNQSTSWYAAAGHCLIDSQTRRPVAGAIYLNFYHIKVSDVDKYYIPGIFIHEVMHIMGFNGSVLSQQGLVGSVSIGGSTRHAITSERVVKYAKDYFGCDTIQGVPLENGGGNGSAGSHWEKTMFPSEVMNPQVSYPMRISELTIKCLEDLTWYKGVDAHQEYTYLKGDGCHTIKGGECNATKSDEFCASEDWGHDHCYPNKMGKGFCGSSSTFMEQCGLIMPRHNALCTVDTDSNHKNFTFESYGPHSRCIMAQKNGNSYDAACLRMRCKNNKVEVQFGSEVHVCEGSGPQEVKTDAYTGVVKCPAYSEMCDEVFEGRCPMDCYGQGLCMKNGTCQCLGGFSGDDCNDGLPDEQDPFVTEFDSRNGNGNDEKEPKDDDEEKDKEDEKDREDEKDEDDEDDKEDEKEEEKEKEDDTPLSERAKELIEKIKKEEKAFDFWVHKALKYDWKLEKSSICATGEENNRAKKCQDRKEHFEEKHGTTKGKEAELMVKLETMEIELSTEITESQHEQRIKDQALREETRKVERTGKAIDYYEAKIRRSEKMIEKWEKAQTKYTATIQKYEGNEWFAEASEKLKGWVAWMQTYVDFWKAVLKMTQEKLAAIKAGSDQSMMPVEAPDLEQVMKDMQREMEQEANRMDKATERRERDNMQPVVMN